MAADHGIGWSGNGSHADFKSVVYNDGEAGEISKAMPTLLPVAAAHAMQSLLRQITYTMGYVDHPTDANSINSKFCQNMSAYNSFHFCPITTKFCTYQDSTAVLVCAKFCCDWVSLLWAMVVKISWEIGIQSGINWRGGGGGGTHSFNVKMPSY